jgi:cytochrome c oxidase cbb3-type subunit 3
LSADSGSIAERMKQTIWIASAALMAAGIMIAQAPAGQPAGQPKAPAKAKAQAKAKAKAEPAQSPASRPLPQTLTPQTYPAAQIQVGAQRFTSECGFCHGRDAAGGESGPDLTRSQVVAEDTRGDKLGPLLRTGRPELGMPAFNLSATDLGAIVAYVHDQKTKFEALGGGRRSVEAEDILSTGNADAGRRYFNSQCTKCHSATGDMAGVASRFQGLALLQRMLYPSGRPAPARPKVTITLASGQTVTGPLASEDEFSVAITDPAGARQTYQKSAVKFTIDDPLSAHFDQLAIYTDKDMHDVFAYLNTLK